LVVDQFAVETEFDRLRVSRLADVFDRRGEAELLPWVTVCSSGSRVTMNPDSSTASTVNIPVAESSSVETTYSYSPGSRSSVSIL